MLADYFTYERALGRQVVLPALRAAGRAAKGQAILDVGCGYGGVLVETAQALGAGRAVGLDLDGEMIRQARERSPSSLHFEPGDFFAFSGPGGFDLILMRDVLEHIVDPERALAKALELLKPGGCLYLTYAPFYSPFGGHQHNGEGPFSRLPWLQFLPESLFRKALTLRGNAYKGGEQLAADMESVLRTRLSLGRMQAMLARLPFTLLRRRRYLVRPDYRLKFGLFPVPLPPLPLALSELLCTGEEAVLARGPA